MSKLAFKKATKTTSRARVALMGPSGSGKTYTALAIASSLGQKIAVIDTERGSASKYAKEFAFDTLELDTFEPQTYVEAIHVAEESGYDVLIIDSLSHAWMGRGGALEQVDNASKRSKSGNSYTAWRDVTPIHNALVDAMLGCKCHLIATMRSKTEYVMEQNERGKTAPRKVGLAPVQRDGMDYEFDVTAELDHDNNMAIDKTRCPELKGKVFNKAGADVAAVLRAWLTDGSPMPPSYGEQVAARYAEVTTAEQELALTAEVVKHKHKLNGDRDRVAEARAKALARISEGADAVEVG